MKSAWLIPCLLGLMLAACAPKSQVRSDPAPAPKADKASAVVPVDDALTKPVASAPKAPEGQRVYRFLLTGHDGQRLDLRIIFDGEEVCRVVGRLDAELHAHKYAKGPRVDRVCAIQGPVVDEERVQVRMQGHTIDAMGVQTPVDLMVETDFVDFYDGWIQIAEGGQATIIFPKG